MQRLVVGPCIAYCLCSRVASVDVVVPALAILCFAPLSIVTLGLHNCCMRRVYCSLIGQHAALLAGDSAGLLAGMGLSCTMAHAHLHITDETLRSG